MHDQSVFQRQADVVKGDALEQAGRIEGNVAVGAVDDGGGEHFSVGQIAFPRARDGRQPLDGKGNVRSRSGNFHIFSLFHHGGQLPHGGTQGGVIHQAGAEIEILKLFRAHGCLLGHSPGRPAQPAPARMADAPLGDGVQGFHGGSHIFLWNGGQFKGVPPAAYLNVGVHVLHSARRWRPMMRHCSRMPRLPDEGYSHFLRNIRQFQQNPVSGAQGCGIPCKLGCKGLKTGVSHVFIRQIRQPFCQAGDLPRAKNCGFIPRMSRLPKLGILGSGSGSRCHPVRFSPGGNRRGDV